MNSKLLYLSIQTSLRDQIKTTDLLNSKLDNNPSYCISLQEIHQELRLLLGIQVLTLVTLTIISTVIHIVILDYFVCERLKFFIEAKILGSLRFLVSRAHLQEDTDTVVDHYLDRATTGSLPSYSDIIESPSAPPQVL